MPMRECTVIVKKPATNVGFVRIWEQTALTDKKLGIARWR